MNDNQPEESGTTSTKGKRAARNVRAAERERERLSVEALRHLGLEIAELVDLRGRIARARAIAARRGRHADIVAALDGQLTPVHTDDTDGEG